MKGKGLLDEKNVYAKIESNCICDSVNQMSNIAFIWSDIVVIRLLFMKFLAVFSHLFLY